MRYLLLIVAVLIFLAMLAGCGSQPTRIVWKQLDYDELQRVCIVPSGVGMRRGLPPWVQPVKARGCYQRSIDGTCYAYTLKFNNDRAHNHRVWDTYAHEARHCREGRFHDHRGREWK